MLQDTIAAIATPPGTGGIGIIRISGTDSMGVTSRIFGKTIKGPDKDAHFESHRVIHGYIFEPLGGRVIDEVMIVPMLAPRSYTMEDVVEIQAHSGPLVLSIILDLILSNNIRLAEPGEFTKRAFLNGRIDLTQAEAVADIINARCSRSLKLAASQGLGSLRDVIKTARKELIDFLTLIEAAIDFPDESQELIPPDQGLEIIRDVLGTCKTCIKQYEDAHFLRDGIRLVICGEPNVGKSSLMNRLVNQERSIVTSIPGTTRDLIEENININGIPFVISDTAGIHQTDDLVEKIGIERARKHINACDLILLMKEAGRKIRVKDIENTLPPGKRVILTINKVDKVAGNGIPELPEKLKHIPVVPISALYNQGIEELRKKIMDFTVSDLTISSSIVPNLRHKTALEQAALSLEQAEKSLLTAMEEETLAIDIRNAADFLGQITGDTAGIDILDNIFSSFCIGK